jgi:nucleoside-diphosphate-sugar epimerase
VGDGKPETGDIHLDAKRVAVTGAGGFIGSATCDRLASEGAKVIAVDIDPALEPRVAASASEFRIVDISDAAATAAALKGADLVVHAAAFVREWGTMEEFIPVNVGGTVNVLDAAEATGAERVLHLSSVVVYGYAADGELDETASRRIGRHGITLVDRRGTASNALAREELGWEPRIGLEEGLRRSGKWLRGGDVTATSDSGRIHQMF